MHRIVKLLDTEYRISEKNVTSDIWYPVGYPGSDIEQLFDRIFSGYLVQIPQNSKERKNSVDN